MALTHEQMVEEALSPDQAARKYDDGEMTNQDVQAYILMNFSEQMSLEEIAELRRSSSVEENLAKQRSTSSWRDYQRPVCEMSREEAAFLNSPYCHPAIDA
jgi:hypothetical protein